MICPICDMTNEDESAVCIKCGFEFGSCILAMQQKFGLDGIVDTALKTSTSTLPRSLGNDRYIVKKKLGSGGMSRVLLAWDKKMECNVVIKELLPMFDDAEQAAYIKNRFLEEAKILYRLDHKGLPKVKDYFTENERLYFVMQNIDGITLANLADSRPEKRLSVEETLKWMREVTDILVYIHSQNPPIIHRDIKPHNIMVDKRGMVFLVDFGIARMITESKETGTTIGTFGYASPEHFTGKFVVSSDIFSLGATFHALVTGIDPRSRAPFDFPPPSKFQPDIPLALDKIFARILEKLPEKRYQDARELRNDIDELLYILKVKEVESLDKDKIVPVEIKKHKLLSGKIPESAFRKEEKPESEVPKKTRPLFAPRSRVTDAEEEKAKEQAPGKLKEELKTHVLQMEPAGKKKQGSPLVVIFIVLILFLSIGYYLITFVFKKMPILDFSEKLKYTLIAYTKSERSIIKMKKLVEDAGLKYSTKRVNKYYKEKKGFRVIQNFNSKTEADSIAKTLAMKGFQAKVVNDPEEGIYVQVMGVFKTRESAQKLARRASSATYVTLKIDNNYIKTPYLSYMLTVENISGKEEAEKLNSVISSYADEVSIKESEPKPKSKP